MSAISSSQGKILLCGQYLSIVANTGVEIVNPTYQEWRFGNDVTVYGENVRMATWSDG